MINSHRYAVSGGEGSGQGRGQEGSVGRSWVGSGVRKGQCEVRGEVRVRSR